MTRIAAIILASLSVIAGARGQDAGSPVMCCLNGVCMQMELKLCSETPGATVGYHPVVLPPTCPSGWLPVTVGDQTWCARELRAPGGQ